jgi:outer membrane lipoprotein-sorting protein
MLAVLLLVPSAAHAGGEPSARQILDKVDDLYRGASAQGRMSMTVTNPNFKRTLVMKFWSKGKEKSLVRIWLPAKERGTATLKNGNNIWNYLPKVKQTIKIPSSMMGGSWMGSDFTNDDLVKEQRMADDYSARVTSRAGNEIEITCKPKPNAAVVWGKLVVTVRKSDYIPLSIRYYKENGGLARTLTFSDIGKLGGRTVAKKMRMVTHGKPGHSTVVTYQEIKFDVSLPERMFKKENLDD